MLSEPRFSTCWPRLEHRLGGHAGPPWPWGYASVISLSTVPPPRPTRVGAQLAQYAGHRRIVFGDKCGEPADPRGAGALGQPGEQFGRQSQALPVVDDGDGDLGGPRVGGVADVPGDADAAPARVIQRAEGLVSK